MTAADAQVAEVLCGVDGSAHADHAACAALALANRLGVRLALVHVAPTRTLLPASSLPADLDPTTFARSLEVAEAQAKDAFESLSPELSRADVGQEVRLGEPATVLAELAEERRPNSSSWGLGTRRVALGCDGFRVRRARATRALPGHDRAA